MAVAVEEEEAVGATQMGMMTIQATILVENQVVETFLHPIPAGMIIQGLDVQSKLFLRDISMRSSSALTVTFFIT